MNQTLRRERHGERTVANPFQIIYATVLLSGN